MKKIIITYFLFTLFSGIFINSTTANTYIVTKAIDAGSGSLREAITFAESNTGVKDTILFDILPYGKVHVIDLQTALPVIYDIAGLYIDGYSQPGSSMNTNAISLGNNAKLKIMLTTTYDVLSGLNIQSNNNVVKGLNIYNIGSTSVVASWCGMQFGDFSFPARNNKVLGCWIGVDSTGKKASTNQDVGIYIYYGDRIMIGDGSNAGMNVISGNNEAGVRIGTSADSNNIMGNIIGLDIYGTARPVFSLQDNGVDLETSGDKNIIGGSMQNQGNIISGNKTSGVRIHTFSNSNKILNNTIGPQADGVSQVDSQKFGVYIHVQGLVLGEPYSGNVISGNSQDGIYVYDDGSVMGTYNLKIQSNYIGTARGGLIPIPNKRHGIFIDGNSVPYGISNNLIGGNQFKTANIIAHNDSVGVRIYGNLTSVIRNSIRHNNIHSNGLQDILLTNNANNGISAPTVADAVASNDSLIVSINGAILSDTVELFIETSKGSIFYNKVFVTSTSFQVKTLMPSEAEANSKVRVTMIDGIGNTSGFSNARNITFYSLTGKVYEGSIATTIDSGTVLLWKFDSTVVAPFDSVVSANISSGGVYKFTDIVVPGEYLIFAIPDSSIHPNVLRTYYGDVSRWFDAQKISIFTTTLNKDVICKVKTPATGSNTIQGRVEEGQGFTNKVQGPGDPFNGIDVSLIDKSTGSAIAQTVTDNNTSPGVGGSFIFENVNDGSYLIQIEIPGVPIDTNTLFIVNNAQPVINNVTATVDSNYISFNIASSVQNVELSNILGLEVYPNPATDILYFSFDLKESSEIQLSIVDQLGRTVSTIIVGRYSKGVYSFNKDISSLGLSNGIYFTKLLVDNKIYNSKFIYSKK